MRIGKWTYIEDGATIHDDAYIYYDCFIGKDVVIGEAIVHSDCNLMGRTIIRHHANIQTGCSLTDCYVEHEVDIGPECILKDMVIPEYSFVPRDMVQEGTAVTMDARFRMTIYDNGIISVGCLSGDKDWWKENKKYYISQNQLTVDEVKKYEEFYHANMPCSPGSPSDVNLGLEMVGK